MIDLRQSPVASPRVQVVPTDPGVAWRRDSAPAIDAPPDDRPCPDPAARWTGTEVRTGVCGVVSPRVVRMATDRYRLFYTQILPRPGFPQGANDYDHATTRLLSASSEDGHRWIPEPGVRLSPQQGGAGDLRVASSEVVPTHQPGVWRMYYECCPGTQAEDSSIRSALSTDEGLTWTVEPDVRLAAPGMNYSAPRIQFLEDGRCRLYCLERRAGERAHGIVSAVSGDGGLTFDREPGLRIAPDTESDALVAFACEIVRVESGPYVMYYAGYSHSKRAQILRAESQDGFHWVKTLQDVIAPAPGGLDAAKCSEMCLVPLADSVSGPAGFRMLYEACDGTAANQRGVWRIASARDEPESSVGRSVGGGPDGDFDCPEGNLVP